METVNHDNITEPVQPGPPAPPAPAKRRHRVRNGIIIGTSVVIAIIIGAAIGAAGHGTGTGKVHVTSPAAVASISVPAVSTDPNGQSCLVLDASGYCPGDSPTPAPSGPAMLVIGQAETIGNDSNATEGTITVLSAHVTTSPADPTFGEAPANGYYVIVRVSATADRSYTSGFDVNAFDFYALSHGGHYDTTSGNAFEALSSGQNSSDITATLAAGETSSGWMAFDVPGRHGYIVYAPNLDGQPLAEWRY